MKRREFIEKSFQMSLALSFDTENLFAKKHKNIGVQLWSVRDEMAKSTEKTLESIAKIGFKQIEGFGYDSGLFFGKKPDEFNKILKDNGLKMPSAHANIAGKDFSNEVLSDNFKDIVEKAKTVGQEYIICPYLTNEDRSKGKFLANFFNHAGEYCLQNDLKFGYHNHDFEFKEYDGEMLYKTLLDNTEKKLVNFEMDLYWVIVAQQKPLEWFMKYPGRFTHFHVKDRDPINKKTTEIGEGDIPFQEIFQNKKLAGTKHFIVELEHYKRGSLKGIEVAYNNLKQLKF